MTEHEELLGADYMEHNIHHPGVGVTRAVSVLKDHADNVDLQLVPVGKNKGRCRSVIIFLPKLFLSRIEAILRGFEIYDYLSQSAHRSHGFFGKKVCRKCWN